MIKRKSDLETLILEILKKKQGISVADVARASGLSSSHEGDRKAIRRVLASLVQRGVLEARGAARARIYITPSEPASEVDSRTKLREHASKHFQAVPLSRESICLLEYLSQPVQARAPISYHQDFLKSYEPNRTFYLSQAQRAELFRLGTAESVVRPAGTYARTILNRLLIDLSWNSSRLEGNTYSILETQRLIEFGESAFGKDASEAQMILNHKGAIEYLIESVDEKKISSHSICSIHALLSENLLGDPSASGRIRQIAVRIGGTNYLPLENPHLIREAFQILIEKLNLIHDPFEQSLFALVHLSYLQAFEDVNKRTARIVANIPLIKKNMRPLSFMDVPSEAYVQAILGIYERNDVSLLLDLYLWAYARSAQRYSALQQAMGEPNLIKLKYRNEIHEIIRHLILHKVAGSALVENIRRLIATKSIPQSESVELFKWIETEILSLHDGNIARFKIRPSEFLEWKRLQGAQPNPRVIK
jgi:Fic family protein/predicted transcriptional regulator